MTDKKFRRAISTIAKVIARSTDSAATVTAIAGLVSDVLHRMQGNPNVASQAERAELRRFVLERSSIPLPAASIDDDGN